MIRRREFVQGAGCVALGALSVGAAPAAEPAPVAEQTPPPDALGSNHNYYLFGGGEPIRGLTVTIDVTEEIFAPDGVGMQLNGYGPAGAGAMWQQYVVGLNHEPTGPLTLGWSIENWPSKELREKLERTVHLKSEDLFNVHVQDYGSAPTFPAPPRRLPAGYRIRWELLTDAGDPQGLIIGAIYSITDNHGHTYSSGPRKILDFNYHDTKARVTREALSALDAFDLNIVGTNGGRYMFIESGAGTITYESATPMTPQFQQPKSVSGQNIVTAELSNFRYGVLAAQPAKKFVQTFRAARNPKFRPAGPLALLPHLGADSIGLFAVSVEGKLGACALAAGGHGREFALGPRNMAIPGSAVAVFPAGSGKSGVVTLDQSGQLAEFMLERDGSFSGPRQAGPKGITQRGAPLAASRQFGAEQTDVFLVDDKGQLKVLWRKDNGQWGGLANIGPEQFTGKMGQVAASRLGKGDRTGVFLVDKLGAVSFFHAEKNGPWSGPQMISAADFAPTGAPLAIFEGEERTFLFVVDKRGQPHMAVAESDGAFGALKPIGPKDAAAGGAPLAVVRRSHAPQFVVFFVDRKGTLMMLATDREGQAIPPKPIGQLAQGNGRKFLAARPEANRDALEVYAIADGGPHDGEMVRFRSDDGEAWTGPDVVSG